jgi:hypothetical protein
MRKKNEVKNDLIVRFLYIKTKCSNKEIKIK